MVDIDKDMVLRLQFTPLFAGLADTDVRNLIDGAEILALADERVLFEAGDTVERFYVVLDGHVEVSVEAEGRRSVIEVAHKGAVVGDAGLFSGRRYLTGARALAGTRLLAIPAQMFLDKLEGRFDILLQMLSSMSLRLRMLVRQIAELKLKTTAQRLASFLLSLIEVSRGRVEMRFPYDKRLVADELGMKPESLSRALAKLARLGVESRPDNVVVVADVARLRLFCAEDDAA
jgi:CRP/FNR family transcriptional activator FtrB